MVSDFECNRMLKYNIKNSKFYRKAVYKSNTSNSRYVDQAAKVGYFSFEFYT
jgi:outer membrane protease